MRFFTRHVLIFSLLFMLTACTPGGDNTPSYQETRRSEHFIVQVTLSHTRVGECHAIIEIWDQQKKHIEANDVIVAPIMPTMGHASPEIVAQKEREGIYRAKGTFFFMAGEWDLDIHILSGSFKEQVSFPVSVQTA